MTLLFLRIFSAFSVIATLIPLLKWDHWQVRIFDYPRLQKLIIILMLISLWIILSPETSQIEYWIFLIVLASAALFLFIEIIPFSPIGEKMIESVEFDKACSIHILVANVYQPNKSYDKVLDLVKQANPDLIFLVETDSNWEKGLSSLENDFDYHLKLPMDNTYGLILYSKFEIISQKINYFIDDEIPSLDLDIKLNNGEVIKIYGIHPTPPVPSQNPKSTDRDAEILIVGEKVKKCDKPALVIGDLNDVAWSYTTKLFLKISEMADPRRGRGTFNTFHTKIPIFRWPLDHVFLSKEFGLVSIKVHDSIDSDHFPISMIARLTAQKTTETKKANGSKKKKPAIS